MSSLAIFDQQAVASFTRCWHVIYLHEPIYGGGRPIAPRGNYISQQLHLIVCMQLALL
jgi:hypothetical protein